MMNINKYKLIILCSIIGLAAVSAVSARVFYFDPMLSPRGAFRDDGNLKVTQADYLIFNTNNSQFYVDSQGDIKNRFKEASSAFQIVSQNSTGGNQGVKFSVNNNSEVQIGQANPLYLSSDNTSSPYIDFKIGATANNANNNGIKLYKGAGSSDFLSLGDGVTDGAGALFLGLNSTTSGVFINSTAAYFQGDAANTTKGTFYVNNSTAVIGAASLLDSVIPNLQFITLTSPTTPPFRSGIEIAGDSECQRNFGSIVSSSCNVPALGISSLGSTTYDRGLAVKRITITDTGLNNSLAPDDTNNLKFAATQSWFKAHNYIDQTINPLPKYGVAGYAYADAGNPTFKNVTWNDLTSIAGDDPNILVGDPNNVATLRPTQYTPTTHAHGLESAIRTRSCQDSQNATGSDRWDCPGKTLNCDNNENSTDHNGWKIVFGRFSVDSYGDSTCTGFSSSGCNGGDTFYPNDNNGSHGDDYWQVAPYQYQGDQSYSFFIYCVRGTPTP